MIDESKTPWSSWTLAYLLRFVLETILLTCKIRIKGGDFVQKAFKESPTLIVLWHNRLTLIGTMALRAVPNIPFSAFVSSSKDGEILAQYTMSYKRGRTIRVPHDAKDKAFKMLLTRLKMKKEIPIITPDGPKGPCYVVKPGAALAAKEADAYIIPFTWRAKSYWELKSWDKLRIPKPFSTIEAEFGTPFKLSQESSVEEDNTRLQNALQALC